MKSLLSFVLLIILVCGCSQKDSLDPKLRKLWLGMSKQQVEVAAGAPTHLLTHTNYEGTWTIGTSEMWKYDDIPPGIGHGAVYFNDGGKVQYVYSQGKRITPPE
ncbi:MAG: hypothetical protein JWO95_1773 [Verrucomicrobiales bacterium]|nr:hypothetical protein [Verrucomicrobiales bacterium]